MNDWRGVEVKVGDLVVYPCMQSSLLWLIEAEVVELLPDDQIKVKRLRESSPWGPQDVNPTMVSIKSRLLTVVQPIWFGFCTYAGHQERYGVLSMDQLDSSTIEIDGGAT